MKKMNFIVMLLAALTVTSSPAQQKTPVYLDDKSPIESRVEDALSRMTLEEKVAMCHAQSKFSSPGVPRLGIPEIWCTDGPHGIREECLWDQWGGAGWSNDRCTGFPHLTCLAATWDTEMAAAYGTAIGEEARYRNKNVLLGPGVNIYRTPLCGRNHEYMGEDPYLSASMCVPYIENVQKSGVATCVKHFALNNQETRRHSTNVTVSDRALYEIYLPAFKAAVTEAGTWSIMGAYMKYKNQYCCHNQYLLQDILKGEWGFDGVVISDWGGTHDSVQAVNNGLDLEYGTWTDGLSKGALNAYDKYYLAQQMLDGVKSGKYDIATVDDKCRRILRMIFRTTMNRNRPYGRFVSPEHSAAALKIAQGGIVLLKNDGDVLPFIPQKTRKLLVIGENAERSMMKSGSSTTLKVAYEITPLEGMKKAYPDTEITYMKGYTSGKDEVQTVSELVEAAKSADAVVFFGGLNQTGGQDSEGSDRKTMDLPYGQNEIIDALAGANKNFAVVIISGTGVALPFKDKVPAIVQGWYCGSEAGNALASVISGEVNPSGKLPYTYYASLDQCNAHVAGDYPGDDKHQQTYRDDIFVGYRYTDMQDFKPSFPFGHGLSYTAFEYGKVKADKKSMTRDGSIKVTVPVTNTGKRAGAEVVQLYIGDKECSLPRPVKELKGFRKVWLEPGQTENVTFEIKLPALQYFDADKHAWTAENGVFTAYVAASAADIKGKVDFSLK